MNDATLRGKAAIIGIGQSPVGKVPGRSPLWLAADAARKAIADAGLKKSAIDGVLSSHAFASPFHRFSVAFSEYFGLQPTFSNTLQVSGATAATMFSIGAAAIQAGLAENVADRRRPRSLFRNTRAALSSPKWTHFCQKFPRDDFASKSEWAQAVGLNQNGRRP